MSTTDEYNDLIHQINRLIMEYRRKHGTEPQWLHIDKGKIQTLMKPFFEFPDVKPVFCTICGLLPDIYESGNILHVDELHRQRLDYWTREGANESPAQCILSLATLRSFQKNG